MSELVAARCLERDGSLQRHRSLRAQFQPLFVAGTGVQPFVRTRKCSRRATRAVNSRRLADEGHRPVAPTGKDWKACGSRGFHPSRGAASFELPAQRLSDVAKSRLLHPTRRFRCHRFETIAVLEHFQ
jgi:hypothetical protein